MATTTVIGNVVTAVINRISDIKTAIGEATSTTSGLMSAAQASKLNDIAKGANKITVDSAMSSTSTNPVQNKVVNSAISSLNTDLATGTTVVQSARTIKLQGANAEWKEREGLYHFEGGDTTALDLPYPHVMVLHIGSSYENDSRGIAFAIRWYTGGDYATATTMWSNGEYNHGNWGGWRALN